jgi:antitoxin CptB
MSNDETETTSDPLTARRKRARFRAHHRGIKEADLVIGRFVDAHIADLTPDQLTRLEALLEEGDYDILAWAAGLRPVPPRCDHDVMHMMADFERYMRR